MIVFLRLLFLTVLGVMTWGTLRASMAQGMFDIPSAVTSNPWFQVTLFDAYFAFLTACVWIAWKEQRTAARVLWVIAVLLWGNFAIATYMLIELFRIPTTGSLDEVFTRKRPGSLPLPATLAALGAVVYLASARSLLTGAS
jgi:hypothetical protein